jgi:hypothetical protein
MANRPGKFGVCQQPPCGSGASLPILRAMAIPTPRGRRGSRGGATRLAGKLLHPRFPVPRPQLSISRHVPGGRANAPMMDGDDARRRAAACYEER